ncbi:alpha/beta hydrolase [Alkalimarinus coralli]|uniref:alpha/beta hydrolase n=1 Tax=Alkalimarinus coralli TaxID=2935863 RepID=UPI00202B65F1|nr:hypothetical protein [Alkalimarinus coralli]
MREIQLRYQLGRKPFTACQADQRFSYCLYVPQIQRLQPEKELPLVAVIHGSSRTAESYRDRFVEFAEQNGCIVLVPLFPVGIPTAGDADSYKMQRLCSVRYDLLLLAMIDEVCASYAVLPKLFLHGFSGGAQFAHRFFYLHPQRLRALSLAAPGQVTLLDDQSIWGRGIADIEQIFGCVLCYSSMRKVSVQMVVGGDDDELILDDYVSPDRQQRSRQQRLHALHQSFSNQGIAAQFVTVPGAGHDGYALLGESQRLLAESIVQYRRESTCC